jgi:hypothetical protein
MRMLAPATDRLLTSSGSVTNEEVGMAAYRERSAA